jgi:hypothetical protein
MVAVLYDGELYDISHEQWRFRQFGIPWKEVQRDTYIIIVPPRSDGREQHGVYPLGGRDTLNLYGGKPLPFSDWGMAFAQNLPPAIRERIDLVRPNTDDIDRTWKDRFAERYMNRWRQLRHRLHQRGEHRTDPAHPSPVVDLDSTRKPTTGPKRPHRPRNTQANLQDASTGDRTDGQRSRKVQMAAAIPDWVAARAEDMDAPYYVAAYDATKENSDGSRGAVLLNIEHDAVVQFVEEFQAAYPPQVADQVAEQCWNVLGQSLVAKVVHAQSLSAHVPREEVERDFLSPKALTTAALGMVFESEGLSTRIGGVLGVKKLG